VGEAGNSQSLLRAQRAIPACKPECTRNAHGKVGERSWLWLFGVSDTAMTFGASAPGRPPREVSGYGSLASDQEPLARALLSVMLLARGRCLALLEQSQARLRCSVRRLTCCG